VAPRDGGCQRRGAKEDHIGQTEMNADCGPVKPWRAQGPEPVPTKTASA
jgi:hypothetical protein